ncbi:acyl-CoA carboxylase complex A subunit [Streptomyces albus]|uniref:Acyl-CoA carboxylase complex A subunit n=1 Tax=Streptomyces albus (strain ATCC 21838 / DSM 41398 / FERM P-419 / JCM 4703 / NBRC 107858) TaxID=1081613 RepID=A0A0B5EQW5_STRA4|nr:acyl-CoA carboxylase complex A subunit [Streptomyces albus]AOU74864.1 acyl-CoA carboxylase complex A subunit [Streptomyces albus]AYN30673.1 acyl-CoA carboxylase complex A subunit [Streptomyces albus]
MAAARHITRRAGAPPVAGTPDPVEGMATAPPVHRKVVRDPAFAPELTGSKDPFTTFTRWIETEFVHDIAPFQPAGEGEGDEEPGRETVVVEVGGKRLEVSLPSSLGMSLARTGLAQGAKPKRRATRKSGPATLETLAPPAPGFPPALTNSQSSTPW